MTFRIIEHHAGRADQIGSPGASREQAIQDARDLAEQELLNGWSAFYTVVDADGNEIYNSENDHKGRIREARKQSLTRVMKPTE